MNPHVSVIIPTYNRAHVLKRAIQSVLDQTYPHFELIIVDDGSEDNTEETVKAFRDQRIIYIRHDRNHGGSAARNTAIKSVRGKYIGLLDDDDEWLPEKLEKQLKKFGELPSDFGVVYTGFSYKSEKSGILSSITPALSGDVYKSLLRECILGSPTPLIKKEYFSKTGGFDETLPSCQDWDMWIRLSKHCKFAFVPDVLAYHYVHGFQISMNLDAKISGREKLLKKYWKELSEYPEILSVLLNRLGRLYSLADEPGRARKYFFSSIRKNPFNKGSYYHFFLSAVSPRTQKAILETHLIRADGVTFYY